MATDKKVIALMEKLPIMYHEADLRLLFSTLIYFLLQLSPGIVININPLYVLSCILKGSPYHNKPCFIPFCTSFYYELLNNTGRH